MTVRPDTPVVLHVGLPKVGSSALQQALSDSTVFAKIDEPHKLFEYVAVKKEGMLLRGEDLSAAARRSLTRYMTSDHWSELAGWPTEQFTYMGNAIAQIYLSGRVPVLSCEGWYHPAEAGALATVSGRLQISPVAVILVKPTVEYINGMWCQWAQWSPEWPNLDDYIEHVLEELGLDRVISSWSQLLTDENTLVRLGGADSIGAFGAAIGAQLGATRNANAGVPSEYLQVAAKYPGLRPTDQKNELQWVLSRLRLQSRLGRAWALTPDQTARIVDASSEAHRFVASRLPLHQAEMMRQDPRWWTTGPFLPAAQRHLERQQNPDGPDAETLRSMLTEVFEALIRADLEERGV
jgi:hypothetical protein